MNTAVDEAAESAQVACRLMGNGRQVACFDFCRSSALSTDPLLEQRRQPAVDLGKRAGMCSIPAGCSTLPMYDRIAKGCCLYNAGEGCDDLSQPAHKKACASAMKGVK